MRLATITNCAYGATVLLTLLSGATMILASEAHEDEREAVQQRHELDQATSTLRDEVNRLTGQARQFVVDGNVSHLVVYRREADALSDIEKRIEHLGDAGATRDELNALAEAIRWADTLHEEQEAAIAAWEQGDVDNAREIMFGAEYERELGKVESEIERFQYRLDQRTANDVATATQLSSIWRTASEVVLAITAAVFLCVLYFVLTRRILKPVVRLSDVVTRLAAEDYAAEPPHCDQIDEIGDMAQAVRIFRESGLERQRLERQRDEETRTRDLMARMMQRMQSCETLDELGKVVARFVPDIASDRAGRLYLHDKAKNALVELCQWCSPVAARTEFSPLSCWALRRSVPHRFCQDRADMPCDHVREHTSHLGETVCLPLMAQQETIGLLYLEHGTGQHMGAGDVPRSYLEMLAENVALAVANLRLRSELSDLAMVDPLTDLANRRKLEQVLAGLKSEADVKNSPVSCLVLDIDHFKRFNDRFGHDAGDEVLRQVGAVLKKSVRGGSMAFRFGGEEFVILLPNLGTDKACERAEFIRRQIAALDLRHEGKMLGTISASIGVATAPAQTSIDRLLQTADAALLSAKEEGRDRVCVAASGTERCRTAA